MEVLAVFHTQKGCKNSDFALVIYCLTCLSRQVYILFTWRSLRLKAIKHEGVQPAPCTPLHFLLQCCLDSQVLPRALASGSSSQSPRTDTTTVTLSLCLSRTRATSATAQPPPQLGLSAQVPFHQLRAAGTAGLSCH